MVIILTKQHEKQLRFFDLQKFKLESDGRSCYRLVCRWCVKNGSDEQCTGGAEIRTYYSEFGIQ